MIQSTRAVVRRLRVGVVPGWAIQHLTVGYGKLKSDLLSRFDAVAVRSPVPPLFVKGEWGSGKTHFLEYARGIAVARGLAVARVTLNGWSAALNHPQRLLPIIASDFTRGTHRGIRAVVSALMMSPDSGEELLTFAEREDAGDLSSSLRVLANRYSKADTLDLGSDPSWRLFYGSDLSWADYPYKRRQGLERIASITRMFRSLAQPGVVLLFDETETIDQLWNIRSRMGAYAVLNELAAMPGAFCVFGVTERFQAAIEADLARGVLEDETVSREAKAFLRSWHRGEMEIIVPPIVNSNSAINLANRIQDVYLQAYPNISGANRIASSCVEEWCANPSRNPRRLIRLLVHRFDAIRSVMV